MMVPVDSPQVLAEELAARAAPKKRAPQNGFLRCSEITACSEQRIRGVGGIVGGIVVRIDGGLVGSIVGCILSGIVGGMVSGSPSWHLA